jgi:UDP-N-acetyl-D-glucosamine dehydrogenase
MSPQEFAAQVRSRLEVSKPVRVDTVAIVGLGYVGLPLAILSAERGYNVVGFDIDEVKIAQLEKREANFLSDAESKAFRKAKNLSISSDERLLDRATAYIVCVPTPVHEDHEPDLLPLQSASEIVGRHLKKGDVVIVESTVNPGVCEKVSLPALEKKSGITRDDFYFAHCPERINPGDPRWNVRTIPRVIGGRNRESLDKAVAIYRSLIDAEIVPMQSIKEAEAVKMVENSFRDINIAFVNELAMAFDKAGIDIVNVIQGASTKPFAFMPHFPGCGVGGHCIPVDPYYLIRYGAENGFEHRFLATARRINERMPAYTVKLVEEALAEKNRSLSGATIALLGLAYKRDVPDLRESPALVIEKILKEKGARVQAYDPYVARISGMRTVEDALSGADAAIIATDHSLFRDLNAIRFFQCGSRHRYRRKEQPR